MEGNQEDNPNECQICTEKYTPKLRKKITCSCGFSVCKQCVQTYIVSTNKSPHCMECKKEWDRRFISDNLNKTFLKGDLRTHENSIVIEVEKSKLPETMQYVEAYLIEQEHQKQLKELEIERKKKIAEVNKEYEDKIAKLPKVKAVENKERKQFLMKCPNEVNGEQCRGFLSSQYKCEICKIKVCPHCFELKGHDDVEHQCKPENVASAEAIKKETKSCPKCATRIFKISGCDQMWCTQCQIAFSWKTGKIETGNIHNPHYYNWKRTNNQQVRNPGDIVCGGIYAIGAILRRLKTKEITNFSGPNGYNSQKVVAMISRIHRGIGDMQWTLRNQRRILQANLDNRNLRIKYLAKEISEVQFCKTISKKHNEKEKIKLVLDILEVYNTVCTENINSIMDDNSLKNVINVIDTIIRLREYVNEEFIKANKSYSGRPYQFNNNFILVR